jgi:hypothetical protein
MIALIDPDFDQLLFRDVELVPTSNAAKQWLLHRPGLDIGGFALRAPLSKLLGGMDLDPVNDRDTQKRLSIP